MPIYFYAIEFRLSSVKNHVLGVKNNGLANQFPLSSVKNHGLAKIFNIVDIELIPVQILMSFLFLFTLVRDHFESLDLLGKS